MSKFVIGFGKCSKNYRYILGTVVCKILKNFIFNNELDPKDEEGFFEVFGYTPELSSHQYVQYFYKYISFFVGGLILEYIYRRESKTEKEKEYDKVDKDKNKSSEEGSFKPRLLSFYAEQERNKFQKKEFILVCFLYCCSHELIKILNLLRFDKLDFYTCKFIFVYCIMKRYFVVSIYNFKIVAIILIFFPVTICLIISSILPLTNSSKDNVEDRNAYEEVKELFGNGWYSILIIFGYIIMDLFLSYSRVRAKVLMDLRYISRYMITCYMGIFGIILISIFLTSLYFIPCNENMANFCKVKETENSTKLYIDNPIFYFKHMSLLENNIFIEIFVIIPLFCIINCAEFICEISIIYHFNPIYIMVRDNIYYIFMRILFIISKRDNYNEYMSINQFIVLEISDIISLIGFAIYFEIIELRFCGLDTDLKRNIMQRASLSNIDIDNNLDNIIDNQVEVNENEDDKNSAYE